MLEIKVDNSISSITETDNILNALLDFINQKAPLGKIAIFYNEKTDFSRAINLGEKLKNTNKILYYVLGDEEVFSIDNLCHLFNLHEDIRLCIALDEKSKNTAKYFSFVRNIPFIYLTSHLEFDEVNAPLFVKNGERIDRINCDIIKQIIFTENLLEFKPQLFAYIIDKIFSIFDYYITCLFFSKEYLDKQAKEILSFLNRANFLLLNEDYSSLKVRNEILNNILNAIKIDMQNEKVFFQSSAVSFLSSVVNKRFDCGKKLYLDCLILLYLKKAVSEQGGYLPNYNERAEKISKVFNIKIVQPLEVIKKQLDDFNNSNSENLQKLNFALNKCESFLVLAKKNYLKLGGKTHKITQKEKDALNICGDFLSTNIMSVIRESYLIKN